MNWEAYYRIDPWGEERADIRSAIIAYTFALAHSKRGRKPKLVDFMPNYERVENRRSGMPDKQFAANLLKIFKHYGGKDPNPKLEALARGERLK